MSGSNRKIVDNPVQKRSLQTKQKIILCALKVFAEKGYYNVTVDEIAKSTGVSTGIAYRYFKNKKDILIAVAKYFFQNIQNSFSYDDFKSFETIEDMVIYILNMFTEIHTTYYSLHEEIECMRHIDDDIRLLYDDAQNKCINLVYQNIKSGAVDSILKNSSFKYANLPDLKERIAYAFNLAETYIHMFINKNYNSLDMNFLKDKTVSGIVYVFNE